MNERDRFEAWADSKAVTQDGQFRDSVYITWQACAEQKDYEWGVVVKLKMDAIHAQKKEIDELKAELKDEINRVWYLAHKKFILCIDCVTTCIRLKKYRLSFTMNWRRNDLQKFLRFNQAG